MKHPETFNISFFVGSVAAGAVAIAAATGGNWPVALLFSALAVFFFFVGSEEITAFSVVSALPLTAALIACAAGGSAGVVIGLSIATLALLFTSAMETGWIGSLTRS